MTGAAAQNQPVTTMRLLPLAITKVDDHEACVGAVTPDGTWVRPEPVAFQDVADAQASPFRYWWWTTVTLGPPVVADPRPEDRCLHGQPLLAEPVEPSSRADLLARLADSAVEEVFESARRSLGLLVATVGDVYPKRSTRGRMFLRCAFTDPTGEEYDWIVPDIAFGERVWPHVDATGRLDPDFHDDLLAELRQSRVYLTIGLTKPNGRFPGRFGGCHPLVVGVHQVSADLPGQGDRR